MASLFLLYSIQSWALSSISPITTLSAGVLVQLNSYSFLYGCQKRVCLLALMIILGLYCGFGLPGSTWWVWLHLFLLRYMHTILFNSRIIDKLRIKYILNMARMKCVLNDYLCFVKINARTLGSLPTRAFYSSTHSINSFISYHSSRAVW